MERLECKEGKGGPKESSSQGKGEPRFAAGLRKKEKKKTEEEGKGEDSGRKKSSRLTAAPK